MQTKKFVFDDTKEPIVYRPGTSDEAIIRTVLIERKEYAFPQFKPSVIYDVGANIGVLSVLLANIYPHSRIIAFEPVKENLELLKQNVAHYKNVTIVPFGLSDHNKTVKIYKSSDPTNHGGFSTHIEGNGEFEEIMCMGVLDVIADTGFPELIKLDCEGAEYEILNGMRRYLDKVKWITGELHGIKEYELLGLLNEQFKLHFSRGFHDNVWHFNAISKNWTDSSL